MGQTQSQAAEPAAPEASASGRGRVNVVTALLALACLVLAGLSGAMLWQHRTATDRESDREAFLRAARDGAIAVSTIDHDHAAADVQRVLDLSTGQFRDDFQERAEAYVSVVQRAEVSTTGAEALAGIESQDADRATVLVQLTSTVSNTAGVQDQTRPVRLRITVDKTDGRFKMSDLEFVA